MTHRAGGGVEGGRPRLRVVGVEGGRSADAEVHRQCGSRRPFARERIDEVACAVLQNRGGCTPPRSRPADQSWSRVGLAAPTTSGSSVSTGPKFVPETVPWLETWFVAPRYGLLTVTLKIIETLLPAGRFPMARLTSTNDIGAAARGASVA